MLIDPATVQAVGPVIHPLVQWVAGISTGIWGVKSFVGIALSIRNGNGKSNEKSAEPGRLRCKDAPEEVECRISVAGIAQGQKDVTKFIGDTKLVWQKQNTLSRELLKETKKSNKLLETIAGNKE